MMKKTLIGATFVAAFAGAVGVSATTVNMKGSDTLFDLTNAVIAVCPGTSPPYSGSGSGNGQNAMTAAAATQFVAPMSRFLNNGACTAPVGGTAAGPQTDGLVIGLDGVALVGSKRTFTHVACNGDPNLTCDPTFEATTGAAYNTTVAGYTFTGWRDVLRVLLAGFDHSPAALGTNAAAWAARDCNSAIRVAIANNYGALFENNCTAPAGDTLGTCTQIRHIFRRDDFSGTTDTMVGLLGLPAIVLPETNVTRNVVGDAAATTIVNHTGATPFCNAARPAFVYPQSGTATQQPPCLQGSDATWDPTVSTTVPACPGGSATPHEVGVYRATMQDNDPIRRACNAAEQVCAHSKDLGLELVMNDVPEPSPRTNADRYNTAACAAGRFASASPPEVYNAITQQRLIRATGLLCPNGDVVNNLNSCLVPSTAAGNTQCLALVTNAPAVTISSVPVPVAHPQAPGIAEGRAYNTQLYVQVGAAGAYQTNGFSTPLPITGAYYRIHSTRSMNPDTTRTCQQADMTDQIGCLVEASPCSIGYAGRGSLNVATNPFTDAIKLNKQSPEDLCITGSSTIAGFTYPLSRKLYLSSIVGFANVSNAGTANEDLHLAGCETDLDQAGLTPATTAAGVGFRTVFDTAGFIPLPTTVNGGRPYCEDFNENMLCAAASNNNGCTTVPTNGLNFPPFNTTCGNGVREPYEDCDCGTTLTPASADAANVALCAGTVNGGTVCTTVCRTIN